MLLNPFPSTKIDIQRGMHVNLMGNGLTLLLYVSIKFLQGQINFSNNPIILLDKFSTDSDGWEPKILTGISLRTERYEKVVKLKQNAV